MLQNMTIFLSSFQLFLFFRIVAAPYISHLIIQGKPIAVTTVTTNLIEFAYEIRDIETIAMM